MSDMITAEGPEELAARMERHDWVPLMKAGVAMIRSLHAQLADAKAAQAMVVERCMATIQAFSGSEEEADYKAYLANELRALADTDGLGLVQALRAERDNLSDKLELERALTDGAHRRARTAEADRDRLAADAQAAVAEIVRSVWGRCEALEDEAADKLAQLAKLTDHEKGFWRGQKTVAKSIRRSTEMPTAEAIAIRRAEGGKA